MMWSLACYCFITIALVAADGDTFVKYYNGTYPSPPIDLSAWTKVFSFDASKDHCPVGWNRINENGIFMCRSPSDNPGCYPVTFGVSGKSYTSVLGMVSGYQKGTTDAFAPYKAGLYGINEQYVDGVSITLIDTYERRHVWTYASGYNSDASAGILNCPCSVYPGAYSPPYVGEHYYCQSGAQTSTAVNVFYTDYELWNAFGCENKRDSCCSSAGLPWFYREFPTTQNAGFEVRICTDEIFANEAVTVVKLALYIQ